MQLMIFGGLYRWRGEVGMTFLSLGTKLSENRGEVRKVECIVGVEALIGRWDRFEVMWRVG